MLNELIYEGKGKMTGMRVLDEKGTMELTLQEEGAILGVECTSTSTFVSTPRPNGTMYGEGYGVTITKDNEPITFRVSGLTIPNGRPPKSHDVGTLYYWSQSPRFKRLNNVVALFEVEVNADGTFKSKNWEWK
jgi:hypothetical protein